MANSARTWWLGYNATCCAETRCNTLQHAATRCSTLQHTVTHCNTIQHTAAPYICQAATSVAKKRWCRAHLHCTTMRYTASHCNTLQHPASAEKLHEWQGGPGHGGIELIFTATHCDTLRHTATHCNTLQHPASAEPLHQWQGGRGQGGTELIYTATHCDTLRHTATHCTCRAATSVARRARMSMPASARGKSSTAQLNARTHVATTESTLLLLLRI